MSSQFYLTCQPVPMDSNQLEVKYGLIRIKEDENPYITLQKAFKEAENLDYSPNLFAQPASGGLAYIMEEGAISKVGNVILSHDAPKSSPFSTGGLFFLGVYSKGKCLPFTQEVHNAKKKEIDKILVDSTYIGIVGE